MSFQKFDKHRKNLLSSKFSTEHSPFSQWEKTSAELVLKKPKQSNVKIVVVASEIVEMFLFYFLTMAHIFNFTL